MNNFNDYNFGNNHNMFNPIGINNPAMPLNQDMPSAFHNIYGFIGGIQGLLNLFQCFLDVAYLLNLCKTVFFQYILHFIKRILLLIKYIITLRGLIACFLLKLYKSYQISNLEPLEKNKKTEEEKSELDETTYKDFPLTNEKDSEERWKEYIKTANPFKK